MCHVMCNSFVNHPHIWINSITCHVESDIYGCGSGSAASFRSINHANDSFVLLMGEALWVIGWDLYRTISGFILRGVCNRIVGLCCIRRTTEVSIWSSCILQLRMKHPTVVHEVSSLVVMLEFWNTPWSRVISPLIGEIGLIIESHIDGAIC